MSASASLKKSSNPFFTQARSPFTFQDINFINKSFPYFSCLNCDILPHLSKFSFRWVPHCEQSRSLTQDFSFLHFCNHKQNRSGCLPEEDKALLILHIYCYRIIFYLRFSHASTYQRHHWW